MVDVLIVGTPRSGTTLVQRLAAELPGVRIPPETHFFRLFAPRLLARRSFPLHGAALREEVTRFSALETSAGLVLDPDELVARLGGSCASAVQLFEAIVGLLAGEAAVVGEKTPSHLHWWRPLSDARPSLRIVGVVRDPRAVVDSYFEAWGRRPHAVVAHRWVADQRQLRRARRRLGPARCATLRYEDIVRDPGRARSMLAAFLAVEDRPAPAPADIVLPWESWKAQALGPITTADVDAWRSRLEPRLAADVGRIGRREMRRWGYPRPEAHRLPLSPAGEWAGWRYRAERVVRDLRLRRVGRRSAFG